MGLTEVVEALEQGYTESGYTGAMRRIADSFVELSETRYIPPAWAASLYSLANEKDKSLMWLEKAYEERVVALGLMIKVAPSVRQPAFRSALSRHRAAHELPRVIAKHMFHLV